MKMADYTTMELMICTASKLLEDNKSVLVGTGLPMMASALAQKTHAPGLLIVFEAGSIGPRIPTLPISVGDSRTMYRAVMTGSMDYIMSLAQLGYVDYAFLGAAQIDIYGNINTTVIGNYDSPKVRLPGSGGGNDAGSLCWQSIIIMHQDRRRFVEKVDFVTTPGFGVDPRNRVGLPEGTGPYRVITQLGIMGFDDESRKMVLLALHPDVTVEQFRDNSGFEIIIPGELATTEPPTKEELKILREEIDPARIIIKN
jgi:glutaconate CoA-transferase subunit B